MKNARDKGSFAKATAADSCSQARSGCLRRTADATLAMLGRVPAAGSFRAYRECYKTGTGCAEAQELAHEPMR